MFKRIMSDDKFYTKEELRAMSPLRRGMLKATILMMIKYCEAKGWCCLMILKIRGLFDPEAKRLYTECEYKRRKSKEL